MVLEQQFILATNLTIILVLLKLKILVMALLEIRSDECILYKHNNSKKFRTTLKG